MASKEKSYDVLILGAGAAGLSAAIYTGRYGLKAAVIARKVGGMLNNYDKIENYPGFEGSTSELFKTMHKQAEKFGAKFIEEEIEGVSREKKEFIVKTSRGKIKGKAVVIALGAERNKLGVKGENKYTGKGVSYCATCDSAFFREKNVAVIGGGDAACEAVEILDKFAKKIYLIYRGDSLKCEKITREKISKNKKVELIMDAVPAEIKGKEMVNELVIKQDNKSRPLKVEGVFIEIGSAPIVTIAQDLNLEVDENNYLIIDEEMKTNLSGVFGAGDAIKSKMKQVVVSAAQGALAARGAHQFIEFNS
ncbi:MAG: FAD-dependent oxidoreductase [archaeon]